MSNGPRWWLDLTRQVKGILSIPFGGTGNDQGLATGSLKACQNLTGSTIVRGAVVELDYTWDDARIVLCATEDSVDVLGVVVGRYDPDGVTLVDDDVATGEQAAVMTHGTCLVLAGATVTRGQYAYVDATDGRAKSSATLGAGAFGRFQGSGSDGDMVALVVSGSVAQDTTGVTYGTPAFTYGTSNTAGSTDEAVRRDAQLALFDSTAPTTEAFGDTAATGSAGVAARRDHLHGMPAGPPAGTVALGLYGSGFDGTLTLDGSVTPDTSLMAKSGSVYTLARDAHFDQLTIDSGVTLRPNGYLLFCRGTVTVDGTIERNGNDGSGSTAGAALSQTIAAGNSGAGGNGATSDANGSNGNAVSTNGAAGGPGGNGGISGTGRNGGTGGSAKSDTGATVNAPNAAGAFGTAGRGRPFDAVGFMKGFASWGGQTLGWTSWGGGASGGGGGRGPSATAGGGGGSGGGVLVICASTIEVSASGIIRANGGAGANGNGTNCGGGGGGGGGVVALMYDSYTNSGTVEAAAGTNGTGAGGGGNGGPGGAGNVYEISNV